MGLCRTPTEGGCRDNRAPDISLPPHYLMALDGADEGGCERLPGAAP